MKKAMVLLTLAVIILSAISAVFATDPNAPSWRGTAGSTYQEWQFSTSANPAVPELVNNPFGVPSALIDYEPPYGSGWRNSLSLVYGSAQGWWSIARGSIALSMVIQPNLEFDMSKDIQVQVVYWKDISQAPTVAVSPSAIVVSTVTSLVETGPVGGGWYRDVWTLQVDPGRTTDSISVVGDINMGSVIDSIVVDTRYAVSIGSVAQAKSLPNETVCMLKGPVVSRSFDSFFYLEDTSRASGIRVNCASGQAVAVENTAPEVRGVLRVIDGERVIDQASVEPGGTGTVLPLGMCNRAVTSGLSPQGLLIRLWGRARVSSPDASIFSLDDGSGQPVQVELHGTSAPSDGAYVSVTGVLGMGADGPVLRAGRNDSAH